MMKDLSTKKGKFILHEILVKNAGINNFTLLKLIHYLLENALTDFFLILPAGCLDEVV